MYRPGSQSGGSAGFRRGFLSESSAVYYQKESQKLAHESDSRLHIRTEKREISGELT